MLLRDYIYGDDQAYSAKKSHYFSLAMDVAM